jgi:nucleoid-associated protein YgaU
LTVAMKEFPQPAAKQNPTSGGTAGHRTHRVVAGDSLASIAYVEYGDPNGWRRLADANAIDDPLRVRDGTVLHVRRREERAMTDEIRQHSSSTFKVTCRRHRAARPTSRRS